MAAANQALEAEITARKQAEEALCESKERMRFALEGIEAGEWDLNLADHTAHRSLQHDRIFGYETLLPQWTYEMFLEHLVPEDRTLLDQEFRQVIEAKQAWDFECRIVRCDQSVRWIRARGRPIPDENGNPKRLVGIVQDITERKQAEEVLRESEQQFHALADSIPNLAWWANGDGYITWYNRRWYEYTGTTPQQMEGWGWQNAHDPEVLPKVLQQWKASIATGEPFDMTFPLRGADGIFRPFLTRIMPLKDEQGRVIRWFGTNTDVSEQKRTEKALQQSEKFQAAVLNSLMAHIAVLDKSGQIIAVNEPWLRFARENGLTDVKKIGTGKDYLEASRAAAVAGDPYAAASLIGIESVLQGRQQQFAIAYPCHSPDQQRWFLMHVTANDKEIGGAIVTHTDITDRKRVEEELHESEERLRLHIENTPLAVIEWGSDFRISRWSAEAERIFGWRAEEVLGRRMDEFRWIYDEDVRQGCAGIDRFARWYLSAQRELQS